MNTFLIILLVLAMIGAVVALVRGIIAFLQTTEADLKGDGASGPSVSSVKQNKAMTHRILFQAGAVVVVVLLLLLSRG